MHIFDDNFSALKIKIILKHYKIAAHQKMHLKNLVMHYGFALILFIDEKPINESMQVCEISDKYNGSELSIYKQNNEKRFFIEGNGITFMLLNMIHPVFQ